MNSDPIYISYVQYLEKDPVFHDKIIALAFGSLDKEVEKSAVYGGIQKMLSLSQLKELDQPVLEKILIECDVDKNLKYSKEEIKALTQKVIHQVLIKMRADKFFESLLESIFAELDKNKNGTIELAEIQPYIAKFLLEKTGMKADEEIIKGIFGTLDKDKNNTLDKKEMALMVSKVVGLQLESQKKKML